MASVLKQIWNRDIQHVWIYAALVFCIYILYLLKNYIRIYLTALQVPGPPTIPLFGNVDYLYKKDLMHLFSHEAFAKYGRIFRMWISVLPFFIILEPEDIQTVLNSSKHTQKIYFYELMAPHLGNGLATQDVSIWKSHRKLLQPAFHMQVLQQFVGIFANASNRLAHKFKQKSGQIVNLTQFFNDTILEILSETILGIDITKEKSNDDKTQVNDTTFRKETGMQQRMVRPWLLVDWIHNLTSAGRRDIQQNAKVNSACHRIIAEKRQSRRDTAVDENPGAVSSILDFMINVHEKNPDNFTEEDIANECCTFMVGGHESASTTTAIALFLLANHPEWQEKCIKELREIFNEDTRAPTMQDLKMMRCLELCIKESLRLYPSVPILARTLGEDIKIGKQVIPKGSSVVIVPYGTHRLPHHFEDPHNFHPERFNTDNPESRHPCAYLPFSLGPRNCIGMKYALLEIKMLMSTILRKVQLHPVSGKTEIRPAYRIPSVRARGGLWVKISDR